MIACVLGSVTRRNNSCNHVDTSNFHAEVHTGRGLPTSPAGGCDDAWISKYCLQSYYLSRRCFVTERVLFRCAYRKMRVPTVIVHGTHDWICPPENVFRLKRFVPQAKVWWVDKGTHTASDPTICDALRKAIHEMMSPT